MKKPKLVKAAIIKIPEKDIEFIIGILAETLEEYNNFEEPAAAQQMEQVLNRFLIATEKHWKK